MFINENTNIKNSYLNEATAEPSYMYEAILEANEAYHDLCMKMVKCEHTCIVNEDTQMLALAEAEFVEKTKATIKQLWEKFKAFCSKMYDTMLSLMAKAASKLSIAKPENGKGKKVKLVTSMENYNRFTQGAEKVMGYLISNTNLASVDWGIFAKVQELVDNNKNAVEVDASVEFGKAKNYIDVFKPVVQKVKALRTAQLNSKNEENAEAVNKAVSICTKVISKLRYGLMDALKVIYACSAGAKAVDTTKSKVNDAKKAAVDKKAAKANQQAIAAGTASKSILDQF